MIDTIAITGTVDVTELDIDIIRLDGGTQSRAELNEEHIEELAQLLLDGRAFKDPITLFFDGISYWNADGFHRIFATRRAGIKTIAAEVRQGTQEDAIEYSCGANATHGLRRKRGDVERAIKCLRLLPRWKDKTHQEIADHVQISRRRVSQVLQETEGKISQEGTKQPVEPAEEVGEARIRTPENDQEKRDRVEKVLTNSPESSNREIARQCDVSEGLVRAIRAEIKEHLSTPEKEPSSKLTVVWDDLEQSQTIERVYEQVTEDDLDDIEIKAQKLARWQRDNIDLGLDEWGNPLPKQILADREEGRVELSDGTVVIKTKNDLPEEEQELEETIVSVAEPESVETPKREPIEIISEPESMPEQIVVEEPEPDVAEVIESVQEQPQITAYVNEEESEHRDAHVMRVMGSSDSPEWYTPRAIIQMVNDLMGEIELDPCSNSRETPNVHARNRYTKEDDGLSQQWIGKTYLNPPYGSEIVKWVNKLVDEYERGNVSEAVALLPGRIDTNWYQPLYKYLICHIHGRIQFENSPYHAPFPCVIVYMGERTEDFIAAFRQLGPIMRRVG